MAHHTLQDIIKTVLPEGVIHMSSEDVMGSRCKQNRAHGVKTCISKAL